MNIVHRSLWSPALGTWIAVSELTRARGRRRTAVATAVLLTVGALAQAQDRNYTDGQDDANPLLTNAIPGPSLGIASGFATQSGAISGTGGIVKTGGGTLALTGANTYEGGTRVQGGALQITSDKSLGTGGLTLENNAALRMGADNMLLFTPITLGAGGGTIDANDRVNNLLAGGFTGGGLLSLVNSGGSMSEDSRLSLGTLSNYTGGTRIGGNPSGRLNVQVNGTGHLGTGPVDLYENAELLFIGSGASAAALTITNHTSSNAWGSNTGVFFQDGANAGQATLVNEKPGAYIAFANSSAADAKIINNGGRVEFWDGSSGGNATIQNNAGGLLNLGNSDGVVADLSGATVLNNGGTVYISRAKSGLAIGSLSGNGNVVLGGKVLTVGALGRDDVIDGRVTDAGKGVFDSINFPIQPDVTATGGSVVKVGSGMLTLNGDNAYSGGTQLQAGTLRAGHNNALGTGGLTIAAGTRLGFSADGLALANPVQLDGAATIDTGSFTATLAGPMSGAGGFDKQGSGTLVLQGAASHAGATTVAQGTLRAGAANVLSANSAHAVSAGATLDLAGLSQTVASLNNAGTVSLLGAAPGTTLTVRGNYVGQDSTLRLGTTLNATGPSDRLVIDGGSASGRTTVQITNLGGLGALTTGNGIEVVSAVNGATTTAQTTKDAFALAGGHVDAGAYEYRLHAADAGGAGENWYLRSTTPPPPPPPPPAPPPAPGEPPAPPAPPVPPAPPPVVLPTYRAEVPLLAALPAQLRQMDIAMLGSRHQRLGDDDAPAGAEAAGQRRAWARAVSTGLDIRQGGTANAASDGRVSGLQAGTDLFVTPSWRAGVYVGHLEGDAKVSGFARGVWGPVGRNDLRSQYLGAYATWTGADGLYVDTVLQGARQRYTVQPLLNPFVSGKGRSLLASVEVGRPFALSADWQIEPQLQLVHQREKLDEVQLFGARVSQDTPSNWLVRAGVRIKGRLVTGAGVLQPYARLNVYRASGGTDTARFVGPAAFTDIASRTGHTSTELAGGFTLAVSPTVSVYGELGRLWSSGGASQVKSGVQGGVGLRVRW